MFLWHAEIIKILHACHIFNYIRYSNNSLRATPVKHSFSFMRIFNFALKCLITLTLDWLRSYLGIHVLILHYLDHYLDNVILNNDYSVGFPYFSEYYVKDGWFPVLFFGMAHFCLILLCSDGHTNIWCSSKALLVQEHKCNATQKTMLMK